MTKKFFSILTVAFATTLCAVAQSTPTADDYDRFFETKTLVVLDDNIMSDFNLKIEDVMKKYWTLTKYDFITTKEFDTKKNDQSYSFLLTTTVTYEKDKTKARYTYLSLLMGKEKVKVTKMPDLISIPLAYTSVQDQKYTYKLSSFIRFIQEHVEMVKGNSKLISNTPLLYYNKNTKSLANKTLYLIKEDLQKDIQNEVAVKKVYPYKFKFVTIKELAEAIDSQATGIAYLHKVGPEVSKYNTRCFKMIIGTDDSDIYYFDYHNIDKKSPDRLLESDLKKMGKK